MAVRESCSVIWLCKLLSFRCAGRKPETNTYNLNRSYTRVFDVFYVTLDFSCLTCPVLMLTCGRWLVYTVDDSLDPHLLVIA